jgi:hypothetical protein
VVTDEKLLRRGVRGRSNRCVFGGSIWDWEKTMKAHLTQEFMGIILSTIQEHLKKGRVAEATQLAKRAEQACNTDTRNYNVMLGTERIYLFPTLQREN